MAKTNSKSKRFNLPGTIYARNGRYWYKVQLPGEPKPVARPLKPVGAQYATTDYTAALEIARNTYQQAIYHGHSANIENVSSIAALVCVYLKHAKAYYKDSDGNPTREPENIEYACKPLMELFAALPPEEFGPLKLIELQNHLIQLDWSRGVINQRIGMIKRMFKWAVARQYISPVLYHGLTAVEGLRRGRSAARETARIKPVDEKYVYAILPYTTPVTAAMIELQLLTGMATGSVKNLSHIFL